MFDKGIKRSEVNARISTGYVVFFTSGQIPQMAFVFFFNKRTTEQQQRFHEICSNLVKSRRRIVGWWKRLFTLKEEKPKMVWASTSSPLLS